MKHTKKLTMGMVVLNALCTVIWSILAIIDVAAGNEIQNLILHLFCAIIWLTATVLNYNRYKREKIQKN